jgi:large subunit ribosomal protein L20
MRTKKGSARTQSIKRQKKRAAGYVGGRRKLTRTVKETLLRAGRYAYRDRRRKRREFRRLWIIRLNAACRERGLRYSQFIAGLAKTQIQLDRKSLSELAINDPAAFDAVFAKVKAALEAK